MVTGFLILPYRNGDDIIGFYRKRIPRVLFPLLFWGVVYAILPFCLGMEDINTMLKELILSPIKMPDKIGGILWYLFILIGIYLFIPIMSTRIYESKQMIKVYLLIWLLSSIVLNLKQYVPNVFGENHWEHNFDMFMYFSGYMGFLLCGYFIRKYGTIPIPKILTGKAVRELKSDTSESYDLKAISEIAIENEAFSSKNSLKNAVEYRDNFQSVSSRHLENEFLDGLGGVKPSGLFY